MRIRPLNFFRFVLFFCFGQFCVTGGSVPKAVAEAHLKVGVILPLTGLAADYGVAVRNAIQLAGSDDPAVGSLLSFLFEDAQYDQKLAVSAFQKLTNSDKVDVVLVWGLGFCKTLAPLAEQQHRPLAQLCIDRESAAGKKFVVRLMNPVDEYLALTTGYLAKQHHQRLGVVLADTPYTEEMYAALERTMVPGQSVELVQRYAANEMDIRSAVTKIKSKRYDAVGVFLSAGQIAQFYRQAAQQGLQVPTFGTNIFESSTEISAAAGAMDGAIYVNNAVQKDFRARYRAKFGNESQLTFGAVAYEFATAAAARLRELETLPPPDALLQALIGGLSREGSAAGHFEFRDDATGRYLSFPLIVKRVEGLEFVAVK